MFIEDCVTIPSSQLIVRHCATHKVITSSLKDTHNQGIWVHRSTPYPKYYLAYLFSFGNNSMKKYFNKVVEWDKNLARKFQDKFNLTDYQMLCVSFAKGFVIGALIL